MRRSREEGGRDLPLDMSDLVANRRNVADSGLKSLLSIRRTTQTVTGFLPNIRREEQGRDLT